MAIRDQLYNRRGNSKGNRSSQPKLIGSNRPRILSNGDNGTVEVRGTADCPARILMTVCTGNRHDRDEFQHLCMILGCTAIQLAYGQPVADIHRNDNRKPNNRKPFQTVTHDDGTITYHEWMQETTFDVHGAADALDTLKGDGCIVSWEYVTSTRLPFRSMGSGPEKRVKPFRELRPTFERNATEAIVKTGHGNELRSTVHKVKSTTPLVKRLYASPLYRRLKSSVRKWTKLEFHGVDFFDAVLPAKAQLSGLLRKFRTTLAKRVK